MCLAVPGRIVELREGRAGFPEAQVAFGGIVKSVCLVYTPEAREGDYVLVHAGFALSVLDEAQAQTILDTFDDANEAAAP